MAMGTLADLEDQEPMTGKENPLSIHLKVYDFHLSEIFTRLYLLNYINCFFFQAVESAKKYYNNEHIYPFMYLGGYYYRHKNVQDALGAWAEAASVTQE